MSTAKKKKKREREKFPPDTTLTELAHVWNKSGARGRVYTTAAVLQDRYAICRHQSRKKKGEVCYSRVTLKVT